MDQKIHQNFPVGNAMFSHGFLLFLMFVVEVWFSFLSSFLSSFAMGTCISQSFYSTQAGYNNQTQKNTAITVSLTNLTVTHAIQKCGKLYSTCI